MFIIALVGVIGVVQCSDSVFDIQSELVALRKQNEGLAKELALVNGRLAAIESSKGSRDVTQFEPGQEVAFMATVTKEEHDLHRYQRIIFDMVITNIGQSFEGSTGTFTAPIAGTYLFNFNIMAADNSNYVEAGLVVNGNYIIPALSDKNGAAWDMGTSNAILHLNMADEVCVEIIYPQGVNGVHGNKYTTFSGYLLHTDG